MIAVLLALILIVLCFQLAYLDQISLWLKEAPTEFKHVVETKHTISHAHGPNGPIR